MDSSHYDVVIVGGRPAGLSAGPCISRAKLRTRDRHGGWRQGGGGHYGREISHGSGGLIDAL